MVENDIPYHPPTYETFDGDIEVDIPYHGPSSGGDRDSLQSDELSIPDWTTPAPPPPQASSGRHKTTTTSAAKAKKKNKSSHGFHSPLEVEIPYHPPLEHFDGALGNVMVEIPSHILDDDDDINDDVYDDDDDDGEGEKVEMELAKVSFLCVKTWPMSCGLT